MRLIVSEPRMSNDPQRPPIGAGNVNDLQFDRVESAAPPAPPGAGEPVTPGVGMPSPQPSGVTVCAACTEPIADVYYEANGKVVCPACRDAVEASPAHGSGIKGIVV